MTGYEVRVFDPEWSGEKEVEMPYTNLLGRSWTVQSPVIGTPPVVVGNALTFHDSPRTVKHNGNPWGNVGGGVGDYSETSPPPTPTTHTITGTVSGGGYFKITVQGETMDGQVALVAFPLVDDPVDPPTGAWTADEGGGIDPKRPKPKRPGKKPKGR